MSREILQCLKRERDIYVKTIIPSQNTAFMFTPALKCFALIHSSCSYCQAHGVKKITSLTPLSRLEMKTAISWHYRKKISLAPKRGYASCESKKCLPKGRQRAFHLLFNVSRMETVSEAPRAGGPVRVGLCRDSAPVNSTP